MHDTPKVSEHQESAPRTPSQDIATILSQLPDSGVEDDVTRVMDVYEAAERSYRAGIQASAPRVGSYASTNG
jgi:hypothetical protein